MRFRLAGSRLTAAWTATAGTAAPAPAAAPRTHSGGAPARKSAASARMMISPGTMKQTPPSTAPAAPRSFQAQKIASWVEAGPGIRLAAARPSSNSRADSHRLLSTHRVRSSTICAGGPPNPITPIRAHWPAIMASGTRSPGVSAAGSPAGPSAPGPSAGGPWSVTASSGFPFLPVADRSSPGRPRYQAERMTGRIGIHTGAAARRQPPGAERHDPGIGRINIVDHDIQVKLLRPARIWPLGRLVARRELERYAGRCAGCRDHREIVFLPGDRQAGQFRVEGGERGRGGAVDDHVMQAPDHDRDPAMHSQRNETPAAQRSRAAESTLRTGAGYFEARAKHPRNAG